MRIRLPWAVVCLLLLGGRAAAQTGTGRISGTVTDVTGAVVPGGTVTAVHEETGIAHVTATTRTGAFLFPSLPVGPYTVTAELTGFKRVISARNVLTVGADLALKLVLEPGAMAESVTVSGAAARVQTTESSLSTLVPQQDIQTLPLNGRNPLHLIGLVPGVVGDQASLAQDAFTAGEASGYPQFTRPAEWRGLRVPDVLLSGDHGAIERWRQSQSRRRDARRRTVTEKLR